MEYKSTLSIVAIILLILSLIAVAVMLKYQKSSTEWPPTTADCPDFWENQPKEDGTGNICVNVRNIGKPECLNEIDFANIEAYKGTSGICKKYLWAKGCQQTWDGITNIGPICQEMASETRDELEENMSS